MITLSRLLLGASMLVLVFAASRFFLLRKSAPSSKRLMILTGEFVLVVLLMELARRLEAGLAVFPSGLLVNTLQVFSLDFDYSSVLPDEKLISPGLANSLLTWYRGLVYSLAPVVGGAGILAALAGISPEVKMFFSRKRKLYVFSELNELSVTLAEDIFRHREELGRPALVFTDCYVDETEEMDAELFDRAEAMHAICLRSDIIHSTAFRSASYSCFFLMDVDKEHELDDQSNLSTFLDMVSAPRDKWIWNSWLGTFAPKENRQLKNHHIYFFSNNEDALDGFRAIASPYLKTKGMPYFHSVRDYALSALYQLQKAPLYENLGENDPVRVAIFGNNTFSWEMFKAIFSCGQMYGHDLEISVIYRPQNGQLSFREYLDKVSPEILESCTEYSDCLRIFPESVTEMGEKSGFGKPYASLLFLEQDGYPGNIRQFLNEKRCYEFGKTGKKFSLADCNYFIVMDGTDEENISMAESLRRGLFALNRHNKTVAALTRSEDISRIALMRIGQDDKEKSQDYNKAGDYDSTLRLSCFGLLKDRFNWERVARNGLLLSEQYAGLYAEKVISHGSDEFPETTNDLYNEWSRIARSFHQTAKMFCAGIREGKNAVDTRLERSMIAKIAYWNEISKPENAELVDHLSWMEHRRWCAFLRTLGFTQPSNLMDYVRDTCPGAEISKEKIREITGEGQTARLRSFALKNIPARLHPCLVESSENRTGKDTADMLDRINQIRMVHDDECLGKQKKQYSFPEPEKNKARDLKDYCELKQDDAPLGKSRPCFTLAELAAYLRKNNGLKVALAGGELSPKDFKTLNTYKTAHAQEFEHAEKPGAPNLFYVDKVMEEWRKEFLIVRKKPGPAEACCLGENSPLEQELIRMKKLRRNGDGTYEVFSRESGNDKGQTARAGDFVKLDGKGCPYPNRREDFLSRHQRHGGRWIQLPQILSAWEKGRPVCRELDFLLNTDRLRLDPENSEQYFSAELWGTTLTAPEDAVLVFYNVEETEGVITGVEFNFVARDEFCRSYEIVQN